MIIQGKIQAGRDWKDMVPKDQIDKIKETDPNPTIEVYCIAQEGMSKPTVLREGVVPEAKSLFWPSEIIRSIGDKIKLGIQAFIRHQKGTNDNTGRKPIGQVVGKAVETIKGKISSLVAIYFPEGPNNLDVISLEGDIHADFDLGEVGQVDSISGMALGVTGKDVPAFPGAMRLGTVQCFYSDEKIEEAPKRQMSIEEAKKALLEAGLRPYQIFGSDKVIGEILFEDGKIKFNGGDTDIVRILETKIEKLIGPTLKEHSKLSEENKTLLEKAKKYDEITIKDKKKELSSVLESKIKSLGYEKEQAEYLKAQFEDRDIEIGEDPEKSVQTFIEKEIGTYKKLVEKKILPGNKGEYSTPPRAKGEPEEEGSSETFESDLKRYNLEE